MRTRLILALLCVAAALLVAAPSAAAFGPLSQFGSTGSAAGQLDGPNSAAVDPDGNVYVADLRNQRISQFGAGGNFVRAFGKDVGGPGQNICTTVCLEGANDSTASSLDAYGVAVDVGFVYVGDTNNDRISVFTMAGDFVRAFGYDVIPGGGAGLEVCTYATGCKEGVAGGAPGQLDVPYGLDVGADGNLYVAGGGNDRVLVFTPEGSFVRDFGSTGGGPGQLNAPEDTAFDAAGNVYVADTGNNRVSVFTPEGAFLRAFGANGAAAGQLEDPEGVAIDPAGNVQVAESTNQRVSVFTAEGAFLRAFGSDVDPISGSGGFEICTATCKAGTIGAGPGEFNGPVGVAADCRGDVYVSEVNGNRVQKLGEPGIAPPPCLQKPSNEFSFGKVKRNRKKGTAKLTVNVPGPGILALAGKGLKPQRPASGARASKTVTAAGTVKLLIKSKGRKRRKLKRTGKVKVKANVTYTPTNGDPNTKPKKIKLRKRQKRR